MEDVLAGRSISLLRRALSLRTEKLAVKIYM